MVFIVSYSEVEQALGGTPGAGYEGKLDDFLLAVAVRSPGGYTLLAVADVETNGWPVKPVRFDKITVLCSR